MPKNRRYEEKDSLTAQMEKKIHTKNALAFQHYRIRPYSGDLHLFRAGDKRFFLEDFEYLGWQPYVKGQLNVHEVPGDHLQLFDPPHGEALAHIFQKALDSAVLASNASREVV